MNIFKILLLVFSYSQIGLSQGQQNSEPSEPPFSLDDNLVVGHNLELSFSDDWQELLDNFALLENRFPVAIAATPLPHYARILIRHASMSYEEQKEAGLSPLIENEYKGLLPLPLPLLPYQPGYNPELNELVILMRRVNEILDMYCEEDQPCKDPHFNYRSQDPLRWASLSYQERRNSTEIASGDHEPVLQSLLSLTADKDSIIEEWARMYGWLMDEELERPASQAQERSYRGRGGYQFPYHP